MSDIPIGSEKASGVSEIVGKAVRFLLQLFAGEGFGCPKAGLRFRRRFGVMQSQKAPAGRRPKPSDVAVHQLGDACGIAGIVKGLKQNVGFLTVSRSRQ